MFEQWGFLLTEIWVLLALAALIGLIAGWLIFGGRAETAGTPGKANKLRAELDQYRTAVAQQQARVTSLEAELAAAKGSDAPAPEVVDLPADPNTIGKEPVTLDEPKGGQADDLKRIKGVGEKLERLCNMMGFWHYDQIANWTDEEVAWVDENLQGFKGRVTRDDWVAQAKILAAGGETEFSQKQDNASS